MQMQTEGEAAFAYIKWEVERKHQTTAVRAAWMSKETWKLADWRAEIQRVGRVSTREVCKARRVFQRALQEDRQRRM